MFGEDWLTSAHGGGQVWTGRYARTLLDACARRGDRNVIMLRNISSILFYKSMRLCLHNISFVWFVYEYSLNLRFHIYHKAWYDNMWWSKLNLLSNIQSVCIFIVQIQSVNCLYQINCNIYEINGFSVQAHTNYCILNIELSYVQMH